MNQLDCARELKRLAAFCPEANFLDDAKKAIYVQEIHRRFGWMEQVQWAAVVTWLLDNYTKKHLPHVRDVEVAVSALYSDGTLKARSNDCKICDGSGWVYVRVIWEKDHSEHWAVKPCVCRRVNWKAAEGVVICEGTECKVPPMELPKRMAGVDAAQVGASEGSGGTVRVARADFEATLKKAYSKVRTPGSGPGKIDYAGLGIAPPERAPEPSPPVAQEPDVVAPEPHKEPDTVGAAPVTTRPISDMSPEEVERLNKLAQSEDIPF